MEDNLIVIASSKSNKEQPRLEVESIAESLRVVELGNSKSKSRALGEPKIKREKPGIGRRGSETS